MAVTSDDEFKAWLEEQDQATHIRIASRAALRAFPAIEYLIERSETEDTLALMTGRAILTSVVATVYPTTDVISAANSAAHSSHSAARSAANSAHFAAHFAARSATDSSYSARSATDSVDHSAHSATFARSAAYAAAFIDTNHQSETLYNQPLWHIAGIPGRLRGDWEQFQNIAENNPAWAFWATWYQGFLEGKPMDWALQRDIALIPDDDWEQGPEHIAGLIQEILAKFDVVDATERTFGALAQVVEHRPTRLHNHPPDPVESEPYQTISNELAALRQSVQSLKNQAESSSPSKIAVESATKEIDGFFKKTIEWCAAKANLGVDAFIKTLGGATAVVAGTTIVGGWQNLLTHLQALLEKVAAWLPFIP